MAADWTRGKIRYALEAKGIKSLYDLDRLHDLPLGTINKAISVPHKRGESVIAATLDECPAVIWPSRYRNNQRLRPQPPGNYTRCEIGGHCQKERAA